MNGLDLLLYLVLGLISIIITVLGIIVSTDRYRKVIIGLGAFSFFVYTWVRVRGYQQSKQTSQQDQQREQQHQ
jgi:hypothetical protein